ncbi:hypothetical protein DSM19430T_21430 [Desulfovibrio psychrotolerans]|uniref:Uncharacterized protein n=1 Tax=Desulfovibrio psychrotolerans TaxID=415242 RepID=A0A7J0BUR8_9BACT|nr:hypothetical protein DSM19430T_21430 [Desulfovibrio psychrotolerans]
MRWLHCTIQAIIMFILRGNRTGVIAGRTDRSLPAPPQKGDYPPTPPTGTGGKAIAAGFKLLQTH